MLQMWKNWTLEQKLHYDDPRATTTNAKLQYATYDATTTSSASAPATESQSDECRL